MGKKRYILLLLLCLQLYGFGQDPQFSQFYSSPLYLSPSLAGATQRTRIIANYRDQWPKLPGEFVTYAFSFDHYFDRYKSGVGILMMRDSEGGGVYNLTNLGVLYSYNIKVNNRLYLRPGFQFMSFYRNLDYTKMEFGDQIIRNVSTSIEVPENEKMQHYDLSGSILAYSGNHWLGITTDHMLSLSKELAEDDTYLPFKFSVYGGTKFQLPHKNILKIEKSITAAFFYKNQSKFQQLDLGMYYTNEPINIGIWFRGVPVFKETAGLNAIILQAGYTFQNLTINYSYDVSTSRLLTATGGAHEVSLSYQFEMDARLKKRKKMGAIPCPVF